jgi:LacI family gluconate utilization system Gnt-I transcriptional repressor
MDFRQIAYCGHTLERGNERFEGFEKGLAKFGRKCTLVLPKEGTRSFVDGMAALDEILDRLPDCDAIFFGTDLLAVGAIIAARRRGIAIPGSLALAGYGDLDFASHVEPSITSIHVSDYDLGRLAGEMLLKRLNGEAVARPVILLPLQLVTRQSTARNLA